MSEIDDFVLGEQVITAHGCGVVVGFVRAGENKRVVRVIVSLDELEINKIKSVYSFPLEKVRKIEVIH